MSIYSIIANRSWGLC